MEVLRKTELIYITRIGEKTRGCEGKIMQLELRECSDLTFPWHLNYRGKKGGFEKRGFELGSYQEALE